MKIEFHARFGKALAAREPWLLLGMFFAGCSANTAGDNLLGDAGANHLGSAQEGVGLTIEANPRNVLSAFVSWTTDSAADSVVQFGEGKYEWEVSDPTPVTAHRILIIGMHADTTYQVKAISTSATGSVSRTGTHRTGSLPPTIPAGVVTVHDTVRSQPGWTLMNVQKGDGNSTPSSNDPAQAVMYDSQGLPVWYYIDGTAADCTGAIPVDRTDKGILIGAVMNQDLVTAEPPREVDLAGNVLWQCADTNCGNPEGFLSHQATKLSNGDYVILRWIIANNLMSVVYEELTPDTKKVWSLEYAQFVPPPPNATLDWCHGNAITINLEKDEVYANCRFLGLIKTTYTNPTLKWHLPNSYGANGKGNMAFVPTTSQPTDTHDPEIHEDGTILVFDNGGYEDPFAPPPATPTTHHSRVAEFLIDETQHTATQTWEFPGSFAVDPWYRNDWYQPFWGDADRLPNGNVLVTAGRRGSGTESRIFEVTRDGQIVWEFHLGPDMGIYASGRISPPLIKAIAP